MNRRIFFIVSLVSHLSQLGQPIGYLTEFASEDSCQLFMVLGFTARLESAPRLGKLPGMTKSAVICSANCSAQQRFDVTFSCRLSELFQEIGEVDERAELHALGSEAGKSQL